MIVGPTQPLGRWRSPGDRPKMTPIQSLTGRNYLSFSQISTYQACPLKWWFSYASHHTPEHVSAALLLGGGIHAAIQTMLQSLMTLDLTPSIDEMMEVYQRHWDQSPKNIPIRYGKNETKESVDETARRMLERLHDSPYLWPTGNILGIEQAFRLSLDDRIPDLLAKIDLLEHRDDELIITDYKTSRSAWNQSFARMKADQLILYACACQDVMTELNAKVKARFVVITKGKTPKVDHWDVPVDREHMKGVRATAIQVCHAMRQRIFYPSPSVMHCSGCSYAKRC